MVVNMDLEGEPVAVKTFDAYVEGRITQQKKFIEPLESSSFYYCTWSNDCT